MSPHLPLSTCSSRPGLDRSHGEPRVADFHLNDARNKHRNVIWSSGSDTYHYSLRCNLKERSLQVSRGMHHDCRACDAVLFVPHLPQKVTGEHVVTMFRKSRGAHALMAPSIAPAGSSASPVKMYAFNPGKSPQIQ